MNEIKEELLEMYVRVRNSYCGILQRECAMSNDGYEYFKNESEKDIETFTKLLESL